MTATFSDGLAGTLAPAASATAAPGRTSNIAPRRASSISELYRRQCQVAPGRTNLGTLCACSGRARCTMDTLTSYAAIRHLTGKARRDVQRHRSAPGQEDQATV